MSAVEDLARAVLEERVSLLITRRLPLMPDQDLKAIDTTIVQVVVSPPDE